VRTTTSLGGMVVIVSVGSLAATGAAPASAPEHDVDRDTHSRAPDDDDKRFRRAQITDLFACCSVVTF